jgi:hypothetical protein
VDAATKILKLKHQLLFPVAAPPAPLPPETVPQQVFVIPVHYHNDHQIVHGEPNYNIQNVPGSGKGGGGFPGKSVKDWRKYQPLQPILDKTRDRQLKQNNNNNNYEPSYESDKDAGKGGDDKEGYEDGEYDEQEKESGKGKEEDYKQEKEENEEEDNDKCKYSFCKELHEDPAGDPKDNEPDDHDEDGDEYSKGSNSIQSIIDPDKYIALASDDGDDDGKNHGMKKSSKKKAKKTKGKKAKRKEEKKMHESSHDHKNKERYGIKKHLEYREFNLFIC